MRLLLWWLLAVTLALPRVAVAEAREDRHALVLLRILAYDKQLAERSGDEVRVVVVAIDDEAGRAEEQRWREAFAKAAKLRLNGKSVLVNVHHLDSAAALKKLLSRPTAAMLLCDGAGKKLGVPAVTRLTRANKVLSVSTRESDVVAGVAVAIVNGASRDEIVINAEAVGAEGARFDAGLLNLARKVGQ